jgi:hypothetical protein
VVLVVLVVSREGVALRGVALLLDCWLLVLEVPFIALS